MKRMHWITVSVFIVLAGCHWSEERALRAKFDAVQSGTMEAEALKQLGPPRSTEPEFRLAQPAGYEKEYREAAASGSVRYHFWHAGIDLTCALGINAQGLVAYKACGGT